MHQNRAPSALQKLQLAAVAVTTHITTTCILYAEETRQDFEHSKLEKNAAPNSKTRTGVGRVLVESGTPRIRSWPKQITPLREEWRKEKITTTPPAGEPSNSRPMSLPR